MCCSKQTVCPSHSLLLDPNPLQLNRIQSIVYETAYNTNENLLISAPTGAGKTNVALLTIIRLVKTHMENGVLQRNKFKVNIIFLTIAGSV